MEPAMSIFGDIVSKIFSHPAPGVVQASAAGPGAMPPKQPPPSAPAAIGASTQKPLAAVDVANILDGLAAKSGEKDLEWRKSIVDLMKILSLDSGLPARRELAKELNFTGDTKDTAGMNVWLHKQVMIKLSDNGGKVPDDLKN